MDLADLTKENLIKIKDKLLSNTVGDHIDQNYSNGYTDGVLDFFKELTNQSPTSRVVK